MSIDPGAMRRAIARAAIAAVEPDTRLVRACIRDAIAGEADFLEALANARLAGEIDDDILRRQVRDGHATLAALFQDCRLIATAQADSAAGGAMAAFLESVHAAVARLARLTSRGRRIATAPVPVAARRLTARKDTVDFRDLMYVPTLVEVGVRIPLAQYRKHRVPILDQGDEGACTGFGLAAVVHYLHRRRAVVPDSRRVSPRMLYALARRYDEWPGEDYEGSSCRGAMKGWHKHGVCADSLWRHDPAAPDYAFTEARLRDAQRRPLGAYFRVNHKDVAAMHTAITEVGILYASASVHSGWDAVKPDGSIPFDDRVKMLGGHAFAIVAYDERGYWIQNSWGTGWGQGGFARISYEDWMQNGTDVWVARLGVPIVTAAQRAATAAAFSVSARARSYAYDDVRPHVIALGNDGLLWPHGNVGTTRELVRQIVHEDLPRITAGWSRRRIVLYAHGGLVSENGAVQRVADYRRAMLDARCYPLAFMWRSDYWTTLTNMLADALRLRKPEGALDAAKDFLLDRLDDALEPIARKLTGKASWDEMKENARLAASSPEGGASIVATELARLHAQGPGLEFHLVAHSAGSVLHAELLDRLTAPPPIGLGLSVETCTLWAPACTTWLFEQRYVPALEEGRLGRLALYTLTDDAECDDHCARIYNKSLLYLVSHAFENRPRIPLLRPHGEPILGMQKFAKSNRAIARLVKAGRLEWILAPNTFAVGLAGASGARVHGGFDDDQATVQGTLARIRGSSALAARLGDELSFRPGSQRIQSQRHTLDAADAGAQGVLA